MADLWFISDTHFGHANFLTFTKEDGHAVRPFSSVGEMDELMVQNWNERVRPGDKVYHLGDVCFGDTAILARLHGSKRLVLGNHDDIKNAKLYAAFKKIQLWRLFKEHGFICSHIPLREDQMRKVAFNVHGHIHEKPSPTPNHICICVEQTNYAPVHLDEIKAMIAVRSNND